MKAGTDFYNEQMVLLPELYKDLAWEDDDTKLIWLPNNINVPELGMVYASGANIEEWKWAAVKAKELDEEITNKDGSISSYKPDMSTAKYFKERDYIDALSYIGALPS
jgi:hypothetical protein